MEYCCDLECADSSTDLLRHGKVKAQCKKWKKDDDVDLTAANTTFQSFCSHATAEMQKQAMETFCT